MKNWLGNDIKRKSRESRRLFVILSLMGRRLLSLFQEGLIQMLLPAFAVGALAAAG